MPALIIPLIAAIIAAVAPIVANEIKRAEEKGDHDKARKLAEDAAAKYSNIVVPKLKELGYHQVADSLTAKISNEGRGAQTKALESLGSIVSGGGSDAQMREADRAALAQAGQADASFRQNAAQHAAQTGQSGTQSEYVAALLGGQQAANMGAQMTSQAAAAANARRLDALGMLGSQGASLRGQDIQVAQAQDAINRFNTENAINTDRYNAGLPQANFNNQLLLAQGQANANLGLGNYYQGQVDRGMQEGATTGAAISAGAQGIGSAASNLANSAPSSARSTAQAASNGAAQGMSNAALQGESTRNPPPRLENETDAEYWRRVYGGGQ